MHRSATLAALLPLVLLVVVAAPAAAAASHPVSTVAPRTTAGATTLAGPVGVSIPARVRKDRLTSIRLRLPASVAALDGRLLVAKGAATLMGVAIYGRGTAMRPVTIKNGYAFGAYGLGPVGGSLIVDLVLLPRRNGAIDLRVLVDSASARNGRRVAVSGARAGGSIDVGRSGRRVAVPVEGAAPRPLRAAGPVADALPDGRLNQRDLDLARAAWEEARARGRTCGARTPGDLNADGCTDSVDLQATLDAQGTRLSWKRTVGIAADDETTRRQVVTSTGDTPDAAPGNGACADSQGRCTLRAAITEAEYLAGDDRITFDLPGTAPVTIQLTGRLPLITSRNGTLVINGYTQNGARPNDASVGSNAIPGVVIRGNGSAAREYGFFITSAGNVIRGLAFTNLYRGGMLDGTGAHGNRIVGNWVGFDGAGNSQSQGNYGVVINTGAHDNVVGSPALADRNVMGAWRTPIDLYGPGTDRNIIQNNLLCMKPNGATAFCYSGVDHNFGPKETLVGGDDPGERNIIGPTTLQGIELSHGWDPNLPDGSDTTTTYQVNANRVIGNWVGFRADGSYAANYRSGYNVSNGDNANGINVYDGTNDNVIARNFVGTVFDGIQVMSSNSRGNIVRGNVIGESPQGEAAPLSGWGIVIRWGTRFDQVLDNTIRHAERGGVGLLNVTNYGSAVAVAYNIRISHTIVSHTSGPAIHLASIQSSPSETANDTARPPVIVEASADVVRGTGVPGATVEVYRASRDAAASGLPVEHLGDATVGGGGNWSLDVSGLSEGDRVTALQIRPDENTSELAGNVSVGTPPPPPPPTPGELLADDAFGREVESGWGTADLGGSWSVGQSGTWFVADGAGQFLVGSGQTREARLSVDVADVEVSGRVTLDRLPVGGNAFAYVLARATPTTAIRGAIRVAANGNVLVQLKRVVDRRESNIAPEVNSGLVATPGEPIRFRLLAVGDQLRLRVWQGPDEPTAWMTTASDGAVGAAAGAGIMGYAGKSVTNGPIRFTLDGFGVRRG